jgi:hypothetical protein
VAVSCLQMEIPVRKLFWDALEIALETQTHRLAKDIAAVLGETDAPLLKALRDEKVNVHLVEDAADEEVEDISSYRCQHFDRSGPFWRRCFEPVVWRSGTALDSCLHHSLNPCKTIVPAPSLYELNTDEGLYYVNKEARAVYSATGELCGSLSEDGKTVMLFEESG